MKKLFFLFILVAIGCSCASAQNANRKGMFIELGFGGLFGKTPRTNVEMNNGEMYANYANGIALDIQLGYRLRLTNSLAYECKVGIETPFNSFSHLITPKILPVGIRYTSKELFANNSLYSHMDLGLALSPKGIVDGPTPSNCKSWVKYDSMAIGPAISLGVGLNITNRIYAGIAFEGQYTLNAYRVVKLENNFWGTLGIRAGYRF